MTSTGQPPQPDGGRTAVGGTPMAVDVSRDRMTRVGWLVLLGGPVIWFIHFMVVYLVAEAGCTGGGPGLRAFNPPVPAAVTLAVTGAALVGCLLFAAWAHQRWVAARDGPVPNDPALAYVSVLLALFSSVAVLFVGLPALVFEC